MRVRRLAVWICLLGASTGLVGSILVGGSSLAFPVTVESIDVAIGRKVFNMRCIRCHSLGEGGGSEHGPPLGEIGDAASKRVAGQDAEDYLFNSIMRPDAFRVPGYTSTAMPTNIADGLSLFELRNLVAFLSTQGGKPRPWRLLALEMPKSEKVVAPDVELDLQSIERGRGLFLGKANCSTCHHLRSSYPGSKLVAPSLAQVGLNDRSYLERAIRQPNASIDPAYATWSISVDGVSHSGRRLPASDGQVRLLSRDASGEPILKMFNESQLEELDDKGTRMARQDVSIMPPVGDLLTGEEIESLLDFLQALR